MKVTDAICDVAWIAPPFVLVLARMWISTKREWVISSVSILLGITYHVIKQAPLKLVVAQRERHRRRRNHIDPE
jgi:cell shape-determining protein MreD